MASEIFLKISGIKGESTDEQHKDEIELLSWSWGMTQSVPASSGTGAGIGRAHFADLTFSHGFDKASPLLMRACAIGEQIPEATLTERKAGGGQQQFLVIKLSRVVVTSVTSSGSADEVMEAVSLRAAKVDLEYSPQRPDGSLDAAVHFKYDIAANKEV